MRETEHNLFVSNDAGGFYCEHAFFCAQLATRRLGCTARDAADNDLVAFLHVPDDRGTASDSGRHGVTLELLERALRGWVPGAIDGRPVLVTGFGAFMDVDDNPTGALVSSPEAVARLAAVTPVVAQRLSVDDAGLDRLLSLMAEHRPWAVLSLGVTRRSDEGHRVETVASDRHLELGLDGGYRRSKGTPARTRLRPNYALATVLGCAL